MRLIFTIQLVVVFSVSVVAQNFRVIAPTTFVTGKSFPFAVENYDQNGINSNYTVAIAASGSGGAVPENLIKVRKGRAMNTITTDGGNTLSLSAAPIQVSAVPNSAIVQIHSGELASDETWTENSIHRISSDLTIPNGVNLTIEAGCWILLDSAVNIVVDGSLSASGTENNAVAFSANGNHAWGGMTFTNGTGNFEFCLFHLAGADFSNTFGHSNSQPVIRSNGGQVNLNRCFIFDCVGKALGADNGRLNFTNGGISRCDTGGEFAASYVSVKSSHIMEIPDDDGVLEDDDNDGFYFYGANATQEPSVVDSCFFLIGEDDGIDHNGAILEVKNCWIEGFSNEGIAASSENSVYAYNTVFKDNEQGVEAGYGTPTVTVDHCVFVGNEYGLRFGDWYDWGCNGTITCTNSIMFDNDDNVHNFDYATNAAMPGAIDLTYSIPTDSEYDSNTGNITGTPVFDANYLLQPGSPGIGGANDGSNMGLVSSIINNLSDIEVTPKNLQSFTVYSLNGQIVARGTLLSQFQQLQLNLKNGIYLVEKVFQNTRIHQKFAVLK